MNIGDCFMMAVPPSYKTPHLWVVISAPTATDEIVIVNATHDWIRAGKEYVLPPKSHRRLPDESYINFSDALAVNQNRIADLLGSLVTLEQPLSKALVAGIIGVARVTKSMSDELKSLL